MLSFEQFEGVYAGLPLPWKKDGTLDEALFSRTLKRLADYGVHGIYNGGSTGEFFAQDFELFKTTTDILVETLRDTSTRTQVGILGLTTGEVVRRGQYAIEKGVDALQVTFPWWYPVTDEEAIDFYRDLYRELDGYALIHYNIARAKRSVGIADIELFEKIYEACPSIIGFKAMADLNMLLLYNHRFPTIRFFSAAPHWFATLHSQGLLQGLFDALVYMNPKKVLTMYRLCKQGKYQEALKIQEILQKFFTIVGDVGLLRYTDAAIDKTMGLSAGFLQGYTNTIKRPYSTPPKSLVDELRGRVAREIPELLEY
jgi:dihydrodipicolinate synthase/N-acetylneuraminate lyase